MKSTILALLACGALAQSASAYTVSFDLEANSLKSNSATTNFPTTGLILLVASTTNATFGATVSAGTSLAVGNFLDGASGDDQILARFDLSATTTAGVLLVSPTVNSGGNLDGGDRLALYWFPTLTLNSTAVPNTATSYGTYQTGNTAPLNGSAAWTMPAASASLYKLYFLTTDANTTFTAAGSHTVVEATAGLFTTAIPEPSSLALGALATVGLGLTVLRRRARQA